MESTQRVPSKQEVTIHNKSPDILSRHSNFPKSTFLAKEIFSEWEYPKAEELPEVSLLLWKQHKLESNAFTGGLLWRKLYREWEPFLCSMDGRCPRYKNQVVSSSNEVRNCLTPENHAFDGIDLDQAWTDQQTDDSCSICSYNSNDPIAWRHRSREHKSTETTAINPGTTNKGSGHVKENRDTDIYSNLTLERNMSLPIEPSEPLKTELSKPRSYSDISLSSCNLSSSTPRRDVLNTSRIQLQCQTLNELMNNEVVTKNSSRVSTKSSSRYTPRVKKFTPRRGTVQSARQITQPSNTINKNNINTNINDLCSAVHISNRCFEQNRPLTCDPKLANQSQVQAQSVSAKNSQEEKMKIHNDIMKNIPQFCISDSTVKSTFIKNNKFNGNSITKPISSSARHIGSVKLPDSNIIAIKDLLPVVESIKTNMTSLKCTHRSSRQKVNRPLGSVVIDGWDPPYRDCASEKRHLELTKSGIEKLRRRKYFSYQYSSNSASFEKTAKKILDIVRISPVK